MITKFGNVEVARKCLSIQFFHIGYIRAELKSVRIYKPVQHGMEDKGVVGTTGKTYS